MTSPESPHANDILLRKFIYGPGIDEPIGLIDAADGNAVYYYHLDGLGSVVALSNVNSVLVERYAYDVFGRPTIRDPNGSEIAASAFGNPYLFTGRAYDAETALYYYRARYYDYSTARFLQPDPIGYADGLNLYTYVSSNPINYVDPLGLYARVTYNPRTKQWIIDLPIRYQGYNSNNANVIERFNDAIEGAWGGTKGPYRVRVRVYTPPWGEPTNIVNLTEQPIRAYVLYGTFGYWSWNADVSDAVHEAGHFMGCVDHYSKAVYFPFVLPIPGFGLIILPIRLPYTKAHPGWETNLYGGGVIVDERNIEEILRTHAKLGN